MLPACQDTLAVPLDAVLYCTAMVPPMQVALLNCGSARLTAFFLTMGALWHIVALIAMCITLLVVAPTRRSAEVRPEGGAAGGAWERGGASPALPGRVMQASVIPCDWGVSPAFGRQLQCSGTCLIIHIWIWW